MPQYDFRCKHCSDGEDSFIFELSMEMSADRSTVVCPQCSQTEFVARIFSVPSFFMNGLSAAEKAAGTTKHRAELGKFMKSERTKRQRAALPGTREHDSNELWAGNTLPSGIKGPNK